MTTEGPSKPCPPSSLFVILIIALVGIVVVSYATITIGDTIISTISPIDQPVHNSPTDYAVYNLYGNYTGDLVFFEDGTGFGEIKGTRSGKFTWESVPGIHFDTSVRGRIYYWGYEIDTILFPENLTMISPQFPGTYAVLSTKGEF